MVSTSGMWGDHAFVIFGKKNDYSGYRVIDSGGRRITELLAEEISAGEAQRNVNTRVYFNAIIQVRYVE